MGSDLRHALRTVFRSFGHSAVILGGRLTAEDDLPGAPARALLSRRLFERRFRGDPSIGASRRDLYRLVFRGAGTVLTLGIALGLGAAFFASRYVEGLLYGVESLDLLTLSAAVLAVAAIGIAASFLPARRAAAIDPMVALKED